MSDECRNALCEVKFEPDNRSRGTQRQFSGEKSRPVDIDTNTSKQDIKLLSFHAEYDAFSHISQSLFLLPQSIVAMFTAYLDDSGTHKSSAVAVVAGYVSTTIKWQAFNKEWRPLLRKYKVRFVHMADLEYLEGQFSKTKGWTKERREMFLNDLSKVIARRTSAVIGSAIVLSDWEELMPPNVKHVFGGAYGWCVRDCVAGWDKWRSIHAPNQYCHFIFESGTSGHGQVDKFMNFLHTDPKFRNLFGVGGYGFSGKELAPLHAADMIAYEMYKEAENFHVNGGKIPARYSLALLMQRKEGDFVTCWTRHHLLNWVKTNVEH